MRLLLIDDETAARGRLRRLLQQHPEAEIVGEANNGLEAVQQIEMLQPDVVLLDIQMPGLDGFEVLQEVQDPENIPLVIFATSFEEHALRAFKEHALAYLLKPIDEEQLRLALIRAERILASAPDRTRELERTQRAAVISQPLSAIVGRKQNNCFLLRPEDIFFFAISDELVRARTVNDSYWMNHSIGALEELLKYHPQGHNFFRARREVLVNLDHVRVVRPYDRSTFVLVMADAQETEVVVSERQAKLLRERLPGL